MLCLHGRCAQSARWMGFSIRIKPVVVTRLDSPYVHIIPPTLPCSSRRRCLSSSLTTVFLLMLEELLAPRCVEFYAADWAPIGTKLHRRDEISNLTGIEPNVLDGTHEGEEIMAAHKL